MTAPGDPGSLPMLPGLGPARTAVAHDVIDFGLAEHLADQHAELLVAAVRANTASPTASRRSSSPQLQAPPNCCAAGKAFIMALSAVGNRKCASRRAAASANASSGLKRPFQATMGRPKYRRAAARPSARRSRPSRRATRTRRPTDRRTPGQSQTSSGCRQSPLRLPISASVRMSAPGLTGGAAGVDQHRRVVRQGGHQRRPGGLQRATGKVQVGDLAGFARRHHRLQQRAASRMALMASTDAPRRRWPRTARCPQAVLQRLGAEQRGQRHPTAPICSTAM